MSEITLSFYTETPFDKKEICRYLGAKEPDEELMKLIDECIKECEGVSKFSVLYTVSDLSINESEIGFDTFSATSNALSKNLEKCEKAVIFAATTGIGIDRLISKYTVVSPARAVILQAIGAERIESLCDTFNEEMRLKYETEGYSLRPRFSPGYGDLPLETQKDIFALLDCQKKLGLILNSNLLMSPSKSVTAFIGIYRK